MDTEGYAWTRKRAARVPELEARVKELERALIATYSVICTCGGDDCIYCIARAALAQEENDD